MSEWLFLQNDQDVYLLSKVSDVMHSLFGNYKEATLSFFDQMLPNFVKLLVSIMHRWCCVCCFLFLLYCSFQRYC